MKILAVITGFLCLFQLALAEPTYTELEILNNNQKQALQKLKNSVSNIVPHAWMKDDIYLVKWLQVTNFNVRKAEDMLKETLKFRKQAKVDQWEDPTFFADFEKKGDYPTFFDGVDREGRPVVEAFYGDWNVRSAAVAGKIKHLTHYSVRGIERGTRKVRELQAQGKNVTQWILLLNMDGFNLINQACPTCMPLYLGYVSFYEKYWPNSNFRSILINTPESFEVILNLIRPIMSPQTRAGLKIFGTNKAEWKPYLDKLIDPTEISDWFDDRGKERKFHE